MLISIVIVNYNVKYFLRQCLASVFGSNLQFPDGTALQLEVWVVDNDSVDGSCTMLRDEFPQVHLIENHENVGFARANNQALSQAHGDLLLLLNPDTIVEHDTLRQCALFMREHPKCGGLTVKLLDGQGRFLRESKRGFPTPQAAFYKMAGLAKLFPRSRRFAAYYMGHIPDDQTSEIEIMCGAFLMVRRETYAAIGGLDETYFMYGEDIDYSHRIRLAGWQNWYLPSTHIIHYKGESTRKGSMNYVYTFYNAMSIFVSRYFSGPGARWYNLLLHVAIWLRASLAWARRAARRFAVPLADFALSYAGFLAIKHLWETLRGVGHHYYPPEYSLWVIPLYILLLMAASWLHGGYDRPIRPSRIVRGVASGAILLLAFYSLLDESQRYSRLLLLLGSAWTLLATLFVRVILSAAGIKGYALRAHNRGTTLLVGSPQEQHRVSSLLHQMEIHHIEATDDASPSHLQDSIRISHADQVVFCSRDIPLSQIITLMASLRTSGVDYKIAPPDSDYIVGSDDILTTDGIYDLDTISSSTSRRTKRTFDITTSLLALLLSPLLVWFQQHPRQFFAHCLSVLTARRTWVGYTGHPGIFSPASLHSHTTDAQRERLMLRYMRHYHTQTDWKILIHHWNRL